MANTLPVYDVRCAWQVTDVSAFADRGGLSNGRVGLRLCNLGGSKLRGNSSLVSRSGGRNGACVGGSRALTPITKSVLKTEYETPAGVEADVTRLERAVTERGFEVDSRIEEELKGEGGFRNVRRTKLIATIGPSCCSYEQMEALASSGVNIARLNMCHGTHEWHRQVIKNCRRLNAEKGYGIVVMIDTEGSEIHMGDLGGVSSAKAEDGEEWCFTIRKFNGPLPAYTLPVNYEGFAEDVQVGDELVVDGGMVRFEVLEKVGPDVKCKCTDPGILLPCANLNLWRDGYLVREKNVTLPTISSKDWVDIDFGISEGVDFIAVSFVKSPDVIKHLKSYVAARSPDRSIGVIAKIEDANSLRCLDDIIRVSDGVMVARGDLGAQIPLEQVPSVQEAIIDACRKLNRPVIVASQLLESMIEYPTPTRAEVADVSNAVRQQADALMLSGESAMGLHPQKAVEVLRGVSVRMEHWSREESHHEKPPLPEISTSDTGRTSEQICNSATQIANKLGADAILVYTRRGYMASLISRNRPDCPIFAFTESRNVMRCMDLQWGVVPFQFAFRKDLESNLLQSLALLKAHCMVRSGNLVVAVSDVSSASQSGTGVLQSIQVHVLS
ncbi:pyruvate kinase isozyme A, chloroplastic isoform X2 [Physcomitrium patens]|uniref:Pyruvate kinase n=2 Tax=Physcomitrium patens TaxID=3218 RepID=A0A2K1IPA4_PHYPA|nr:pyruvate kinase isozyme A, chloroplastic-like isoform X2 [Physcomitrium patens]PNR31097.1 hypothetical protein PHYPA_027413 [Physcomitrium patens]|eukprot:XP_024361194.1 pyruvate kinase isozyme A, chloroplastic-like isoform X2 [Physcomitrella patens]